MVLRYGTPGLFIETNDLIERYDVQSNLYIEQDISSAVNVHFRMKMFICPRISGQGLVPDIRVW